MWVVVVFFIFFIFGITFTMKEMGLFFPYRAHGGLIYVMDVFPKTGYFQAEFRARLILVGP